MRLDKEVFCALGAIIWADGVVTDSEAEALVGAARASGVAGKDLDEVIAATKKKTDVAQVKSLKLGAEEKVFVYAIAAWLTRADGKVTAEETDALGDLGDMLDLSDDDRAVAIASSEALDAYGSCGKRDVSQLAEEIKRAAGN
jgi:hypothetical protein